MKRGYQESSSSGSFGPPQSKFKYNPEGDAQFLEDDSTKMFARKVADHYSSRTNQTLEEREASPIIHLKKLNNWIKSVLIQLYTKKGDAVLDLACGKGGDLIKWDKAKIGYYVGIDIANGSVRLDKVLADDAPFDVCSCSGHFSAIDGMTFGNSVYWIRFDEEFENKKFKSSNPFGIKYKFHLEDAVDCPEWIVPFHVFKSMAEEYDLELIFAKNAHVFVDEYLKKPEFVELMRRLGALGDGKDDQSTLSPDEWDAAYLYLAFVLRKRGQPDQTQVSIRQDKGKMHLSMEDIMYISGQGANQSGRELSAALTAAWFKAAWAVGLIVFATCISNITRYAYSQLLDQ
ncbi:UNVERIFIED_CONTAM: cap guanine-N7 methyltransferase 1 [Sesamum angustifolium]|uniref:mRNA (guanine-N(7))-methyltransferase n=1 Tax=Sesamum angustifolium TaxID=2727405 RepID=A0AAW2PBU5_9LAMI